MSNNPWWTVISSKEIFQLRTRLSRYLEASFSSTVSSDRDDLVQHALLMLIRSKERVLPDDDGLFRFARQVAKNAALDLVKSKAHQLSAARGKIGSKISVGASAESELTDIARYLNPTNATTSSPAQSVKNEEILRVRKIFCELDDLNRLVLWSYVVDGNSINAIARQLDIDWHRVSDLIVESLDRLRQQIS